MTWYLLESGNCDWAYNMALDEAMLSGAVSLDAPILRFYGWSQPAASFGYFQKYAEVERLTLLRPLVRRPTGGGIVPHDADWTYSLAFPPAHEWYALSARESYRRVHDWVRVAFGLLGEGCDLAPVARKSAPGQCFVGYEQSDVLWHGRKIAGAAQRRTRAGLLIQGSVQPPLTGLARAAWQAAMTAAADDGTVQWQPLTQDVPALKPAERLAAEKYLNPAYNRKR